MRPQGVIRKALLDAARELAEQKGAASLREIAANAKVRVQADAALAGEAWQCGVSMRLARSTWKNMAFAGEVEMIGREKPAGQRRWHGLWAPCEALQCPDPYLTTAQPLDGVLRAWMDA